MSKSYLDRLNEQIADKNSRVCVGLDPRYSRLPDGLRGEIEELTDAPALRYAEGYRRFCRGITEAVSPFAAAVKPQWAFFEAAGPAALGALVDVVAHARENDLLVIADAKRGDIGSTAEAYARAFFGSDAPCPVDALTVNPYLGRDAVEPLVSAAAENGGLVYLLIKTSNPGSADLQDLILEDGRPLWRATAELARELAGEYPGAVGCVFGATHPDDLRVAADILEGLPLLLPGYGAQGAGAAELAPALTGSNLINSSRGIIFAHESSQLNWRQAAARAAMRMQEDLAGTA
ncbi:MAG: orotidine-5'-phosphate decarboxylase [Candidatus Coatesbacteria bacterium]|nr:orotidine-5'-phosphate decarboxylase [Candidatus Coatesbacteria bacterium]